MLNQIKKSFFAGLLVLTPITLTIYLFILLFQFLDGILRDVVSYVLINQVGLKSLKAPIPGLGLLVLLLLIISVGFFARNYFGKKLFAIGDYIVTHIPLINRIYIAIRQISEAILTEKRELFKKVVLIEYPRKDLYSIGFFTQDTKGKVQETLPTDVVSVFIPTSPNPTSGYLLFVPKKDIIELDMAVEDALKLVISGGSVYLKNQEDITHFLKKKKRRSLQKKQ